MTEPDQSWEGEHQTYGHDVNPRRPFSVTLLALGVLSITGLNLARFILAVDRWEFLEDLPGISPLYISLTGLAWSAAGLVLFWGIWRGLSWAIGFTRAVLLSYAAYYWLDRIFLAERVAVNAQGETFLPLNWPFAVTITAIILAVTVWILSRPDTKAFFGEKNE